MATWKHCRICEALLEARIEVLVAQPQRRRDAGDVSLLPELVFQHIFPLDVADIANIVKNKQEPLAGQLLVKDLPDVFDFMGISGNTMDHLDHEFVLELDLAGDVHPHPHGELGLDDLVVEDELRERRLAHPLDADDWENTDP
uniref:Uncharacterized protein n=1 Tax=Oryza rufipogon TaxID=4529 RepID=A0A0E0NXE3_ORYRU